MALSACLILKVEKGTLVMQRLRISSHVTLCTCVLMEMSRLLGSIMDKEKEMERLDIEVDLQTVIGSTWNFA